MNDLRGDHFETLWVAPSHTRKIPTQNFAVSNTYVPTAQQSDSASLNISCLPFLRSIVSFGCLLPLCHSCPFPQHVRTDTS